MITSPCLKILTSCHSKKSLKTISSYQLHTITLQPTTPPSQSRQSLLQPRDIQNAHHPFDKSSQSDRVDYNLLLFDYMRNGCNREALNLFLGCHSLGLFADGSTLSCVLKISGRIFDQVTGRQIHSQCVKLGFVEDISVGTALVDMYMKTENVKEGRRAFDEMGERNVVSWTSLLTGYARNELRDEALELFYLMQVEGINPNSFTFATVLGILAENGMIEKGIQVHCRILKSGFDSTTSVWNSVMNMYMKSGKVREGRTVFDRMEEKDEVTWNGIISGYVSNGLYLEAFEMFHQMRISSVVLSQMIFATIIKLCSTFQELGFVKQLHCMVLKAGYESVQNIRIALMVTYSKCSEMDDAFKIFSVFDRIQNVVSWTAIISGFIQNGRLYEAANLFHEMNREFIRPNHFTYSTILTAHPAISVVQIHSQVIKTNYEKSSSVGTALLDAYVKTGEAHAAAKVFELIEEKDIIAWSAMLAGYAQRGDSEKALEIFLNLAKEGVKPNKFTFSSITDACASPSASVEQGKQVHASAIKWGLNNSICVSSALVTMYSKRGDIESANEVFKRQPERDLVSWNSMISGFAQHGHAKKALEIFKEMQREMMEMDGITFIGVISACTHVGLVEEGQKYFNIMVKEHNIYPKMEHYSCMVDLYSRAGMLDKAMEIINGMSFPPSATVWRSILASCRVHRNLELGKIAAEKLLLLEPQDSSPYVLLSNIYASTGDWKERAKVRKLMDQRRVKKEAGYSWIEVKNRVYSFLAGDVSHPMSERIYSKLEELSVKLKDAGYQPDTNYVLHDIEEEQKEAILSRHSERLALAYGLIATPPETTIQIVKNIRVCGDCHAVIKLISMIERRYIVVRDSLRFHHFKVGSCSCGDYW